MGSKSPWRVQEMPSAELQTSVAPLDSVHPPTTHMRELKTAVPCLARPGNGAAGVTWVQLIPSDVDQTSFSRVSRGVLLRPPISHIFPLNTTRPASPRDLKGPEAASRVQFTPSSELQV